MTASHDSKYDESPLWRYLSRYAFRFRSDIYRIFAHHLPPEPSWTVLDLGVDDREINYFHRLYPYTGRITAAGLSDRNITIENHFPAIVYVQIPEDPAYPFADNSFDVVHASAVIEHVGSRERQRAFMREATRIGKSGMISTPNRYFPVELHTYLPLIHWLPTRLYRRLYYLLGLRLYSQEETLNLLSFRDLDDLVKQIGLDNYWYASKRTFGFVSNYLLFWKKR